MEWNACGEGRVALSAGGFHVSSGTPHQQRVVILGRLSARTSDRPGFSEYMRRPNPNPGDAKTDVATRSAC